MLRHHPPPGAMDTAGWISMPLMMANMRSKPTVAEIVTVIENNDKKRFELDTTTQPARVRAAQGHSIELEDLEMTRVHNSSQAPLAIHVTSDDGWLAIQKSGELRSMSRTHIHFATQPHHMRQNGWIRVALKLDVQAALDSGKELFLSSNGVLLCRGPLPVALVSRVGPDDLPHDWRTAFRGS